MERAGLEYSIRCDELEEPVYVDREMWEKIVLNLISNALKFTFAGRVTVALKQVATQVEFTVQDTGTGIPEEELPHIFERFHRVEGSRGRTIEGTGIGLALVQELVKLHGGSVQVSSQLNVGSTFTVSIALGTEHLPNERIKMRELTSTALRPDAFLEESLRWLPLAVDGHENPFEGALPDSTAGLPRILLVDDNADMRDYVSRLLAKRYAVVAVSNGSEALASAVAEPPDLILSDVMMPGLTGFELVEALRQKPQTRTIPVILLSARAGEESTVEGLAAGADDYLVKPFTARELLARVGAHLAMRKRRAEAEQALRESEERLRRSNNELERVNADLEQFAYSASHDLQEPLRQVAIYSELLEKRFGNKLEGKGLEYLGYCVEGAHRMEMLIRDLLAYSQAAKSPNAAVEIVDINEVLAGVEKNLASAIDESGAVISGSDLPALWGDAVPFTHLFQNLISNALKYRSERPPRIVVSARKDGGSWLFAVQDNGIGIPKEFQTQIFGIFKRLHNKNEYPGTGIGLAICQKVVERYGGRIWVESEVGQGSTFFFTLPYA
jgi:signal transduction histidine kinase